MSTTNRSDMAGQAKPDALSAAAHTCHSETVTEPPILVFSSLFPHQADSNGGLFIRERMFRVARKMPIVVVSPKPWSPFDAFIRHRRPRFRPQAPRYEVQQGIEVHAPRFLSLPGVLKSFDSLFMALGSYTTVRRLQRKMGCKLIDAHFAYPDGHAASLLAKWLKLPYTITLRGSEKIYAQQAPFRKRIATGLRQAAKIFAVSESLRQLALSLGAGQNQAMTVSNAVDSDKFQPLDQRAARRHVGIPEDIPVLISVGWLVEGKGFHRVIECLPELVSRHPGLRFLIIGGPSAAGSMEPELRRQVTELGLEDSAIFVGPKPQSELKWWLSAADVFVLATRREGWANVFLEAMACGLPVVTTHVDGNPEVVCKPELGELVPFGDKGALLAALDRSLNHPWDRQFIRAHAEENSWDKRVETLCGVFRELTGNTSSP